MENNSDNGNKNESKITTSKTIEVAETVEKPKKQKRKFEWTPKRKFEWTPKMCSSKKKSN